MALVGHISGSSQSNSIIGISGTVIVANRPNTSFPSALPGADVSFFVSGSRGGKGSLTERTVSVFGGDAVVSGSLTIGTGSITITSNDIQFSNSAYRIELDASNNIRFFDAANPSGVTVTSLATSSPAGSDTQVQFNDGGSLAGDSGLVFNKTTDTLTIGGDLVVTGNDISGSSGLNITLGGSGDVTVAGDLTVSGGKITLTNGSTIDSETAGTLLLTEDIVKTSGDLLVGGNDIQASDGNTNITLTSNTLTAFAGDIKVGGNDIQASDGTVALTLTDASGNVSVAGDLTVTGNDIKSSGGTTAITLSGANVILPGDLTVNGTTITADVTTVTVEDPIIGLGFTSGSVDVTAGDRGWVGGLAGADNATMAWLNSPSEFVVARTTSDATSTSITVSSYGNFHANNIQGNIISASLGFSGSLTKLIDGTSYLIAGSGITITSASNGAVTIASGAGAGDVVGPASATDNAIARFDLTTGKLIQNSAITISDEAANSVTIAGSATATTVSLFPSTVTALNLGGASTVSTAAGGVQVGENLGVTGSAQFNGAVTLGDTSGDAISVIGTMTVTPNATFSGDIAVNGGDVTTTATTATVFNTNATTVSVFGAATALNIGSTVAGNQAANFCSSATGSVTLNIGSGATASGVTKAVNVGTGGAAGSTTNVTLGSSNGGTVNSAGNFAVNSNKFTVSSATGDTVVSGSLSVYGNVTLGDLSTDTITFTGQANSDLLPATDRLYNLGSATNRWNNIYTGDLHLRNERGNWTVIEEETYLSIRNNHTGRMYKFVLEEIPGPLEPLDE